MKKHVFICQKVQKGFKNCILLSFVTYSRQSWLSSVSTLFVGRTESYFIILLKSVSICLVILLFPSLLKPLVDRSCCLRLTVIKAKCYGSNCIFPPMTSLFFCSRLTVIKAKCYGSNCVFPPMTSLLHEAGIDVAKLEEVTLETVIF